MAAQPREERKDDIKQARQRIHVVPVERRRTVFLIGAPGSGKAAIKGLDVAMLFYRTGIGESTWIAFRDRANLKKIELPDRVTSVDFMAFADPSRTNDESDRRFI